MANISVIFQAVKTASHDRIIIKASSGTSSHIGEYYFVISIPGGTINPEAESAGSVLWNSEESLSSSLSRYPKKSTSWLTYVWLSSTWSLLRTFLAMLFACLAADFSQGKMPKKRKSAQDLHLHLHIAVRFCMVILIISKALPRGLAVHHQQL